MRAKGARVTHEKNPATPCDSLTFFRLSIRVPVAVGSHESTLEQAHLGCRQNFPDPAAPAASGREPGPVLIAPLLARAPLCLHPLTLDAPAPLCARVSSRLFQLCPYFSCSALHVPGRSRLSHPVPAPSQGCVVPNGVLKRDVKRLGPAKVRIGASSHFPLPFPCVSAV